MPGCHVNPALICLDNGTRSLSYCSCFNTRLPNLNAVFCYFKMAHRPRIKGTNTALNMCRCITPVNTRFFFAEFMRVVRQSIILFDRNRCALSDIL
ncbi:Uncharacterised protein [Vibrio cholerae]|nr:Uncharacterised protein [Vibrio cholerae]CSD04005.1 Uncharacterised protein [Vibrio cholerae]CSI86267.1 Uncharacterised protein [Vibrio cholerae]